MMSLRRETLLTRILEMKQEDYEKIFMDIYRLYEKGRLRVLFSGPYFRAVSLEEDEKLLMKKHNQSRKEIHEIIRATLLMIHFVFSEEEEEMLVALPKKAVGSFKKKTAFVSRILKRDPTLWNTYFTYSLSKGNFFAGIDWEAEIKVFHSPHEYLVKPPALPVGRIRIALLNNNEDPPKEDAVQFEISSKDLATMLSCLGDLRKALENLEAMKIVPKEGR